MQISDLVQLSYYSQIVIVSVGAISLVGSVGLSSQWRLKRFLGYSAISNLGFVLLTLGLFQLDSYLYYITIYAITTLNLFAILGTLPFSLSLSGLFYLNLEICQPWAFSLFSLAGIPPFAGFYAKLLVLSAINSYGPIAIAMIVIVIISSALSAANYLSLVKVTCFDLPKVLLLFLCPVATSYYISFVTYGTLLFLVIPWT